MFPNRNHALTKHNYVGAPNIISSNFEAQSAQIKKYDFFEDVGFQTKKNLFIFVCGRI